jgi:trk system potassium uptake protein TrkA
MSKRFENILILGLGGVGSYLAKWLAHEGHAITVIESDPDKIRRADGEVDARLIRGDAMHFSCWRKAITEKMDYLIAVTDNDAVNIMSSLIADRCGIRQTIARVRSLEIWEDDALLTPKDLKVDLVIRPAELAAQEIFRLLKMRAGNIVIDLAEGHMQVVATRVRNNSPLAHLRIGDLAKKHDAIDFRIVAISRGIATFIPGGDQKVLPHDHVFVLAHTEDLPQLMHLTGVSEKRRHRVLIVGGGLIGARVAELLEGSFPVTLVEQDERRAEELSYLLKKTEVLHGDGSDADTLNKAGLLRMDTVITATGDSETNIMTSVLAKQLLQNHSGSLDEQGGKTITLVKRESYLVLASSMGSDIVLNKKVLAGNQILKHIRRGKLLSLAHLHGCDAEVLELVAEAGAPIVGKPLHELTNLRNKIIIGGVGRKGVWQAAVGSTVIEPGDKVIGVCNSRHIRDLERLLLS